MKQIKKEPESLLDDELFDPKDDLFDYIQISEQEEKWLEEDEEPILSDEEEFSEQEESQWLEDTEEIDLIKDFLIDDKEDNGPNRDS
jgi:hypothetical protein